MDSSSRPPPPGRPKDLEKRAAILEAAKLLFIEQGYGGTSMDAVAQHAGVSKLTVYSHFKDKEALFVEAVKARCEEQMPPEMFLAELSGPISEQLTKIGHAFFSLITSEEAIAIHRVMARQLPGDARLPTLFWEAGPQRTLTVFADFLRAETEAGQLQVDDPGLAASQFFCLLKGDYHARLLCGCHEPCPETDVARHIAATVTLFMRAYGPASH